MELHISADGGFSVSNPLQGAAHSTPANGIDMQSLPPGMGLGAATGLGTGAGTVGAAHHSEPYSDGGEKDLISSDYSTTESDGDGIGEASPLQDEGLRALGYYAGRT